MKPISDSDEQKRSSVHQGKIGVTPSVAAPGDTNASDATGFGYYAWMERILFKLLSFHREIALQGLSVLVEIQAACVLSAYSLMHSILSSLCECR